MTISEPMIDKPNNSGVPCKSAIDRSAEDWTMSKTQPNDKMPTPLETARLPHSDRQHTMDSPTNKVDFHNPLPSSVTLRQREPHILLSICAILLFSVSIYLFKISTDGKSVRNEGFAGLWLSASRRSIKYVNVNVSKQQQKIVFCDFIFLSIKKQQ